MVKQTVPARRGREQACMIEEDGHTYCIDPLEETLQLISRRWALLVIGILGNRDGVRFSEAKATIPGISARALSTVLSDMKAHRLVTRRVDERKSPPSVTYSLTKKGRTLRAALIPLIQWAGQEA